MPNRSDGASSPEWWDDLPPEVKRRVARPAPEPAVGRETDRAPEVPASHRPTLLADLSRLALLFLVIVLANVLFLLIALSFLTNRGSTVAS
ncbi:MAG TPA: hypothetical protein VM529_00310 [Gemmata sp.]|nr:hypothetical protein [Gemmata sp.]